MPKLAIMIGNLLILVGIVGYFVTDRVSLTALIPSAFGVLLALLGVLALVKPGARKHAMHVAAALALVGLLGTISGVIKLVQMAAGAQLERPAAAVSQGITAALCVLFLILAIRSFIDARRQREAAAS